MRKVQDNFGGLADLKDVNFVPAPRSVILMTVTGNDRDDISAVTFLIKF